MTDLAGPGRRKAERRAEPVCAGRVHTRDDWRMVLVMLAFLAAFGAVGSKMSAMALSEPDEPRRVAAAQDIPVRGEITDRHGRLLAGSLPAWSLYAHPQDVRDPAGLAAKLAAIFPDLDHEKLEKDLSSERKFLWIKRPITPAQRAAVHDLGDPGLAFGQRPMRVYPAGAVAAHIVGSTKAAREDVRFTELVGAGGAEAFFDERLRDPDRNARPLALSIDLAAQTALRDILARGMTRLTAKGAAGVMMDVKTGEVLAMVSLPDYDPNVAPQPYNGPIEYNPRFDRVALGRYELGSTFKPLTAAFAMDAGIAGPGTMIETKGSLWRGRIRDAHRMPDVMSLTDIIRRSSNVGTARLAMVLGNERFQAYLNRMGLFDPSGIELLEASRAKPLKPKKWIDVSTMTVSFGHGLSVSPLHMAAAYATLANEGRRVLPSLRRGGRGEGDQVVSPSAAKAAIRMMRAVVADGTGRRAEVPGYEIAGKTGTAEKIKLEGRGYDSTRVVSTFASVFPASDPAYVLVVTMDEPTNREGERPVREASRTAAPLVAEAVERIAPILGLAPIEPAGTGGAGITRVSLSD